MCNCARLSAAVYVLGLCGYRCADGCSCMKCPQGEGRAWACTPAVCWGGVVCWYLRCVCSLCLYAVCVCVCVCGMHTGRVVWGRAETERRSQAKDNVQGWISPIILLVFSDGIHHLPDQDHSRDM